MWIGDVTKLLYQDECWIPRNNQSIRVVDMEDAHLANWLKWAEDRAYDWFNRFFDFSPEYRRRFLSDTEFVFLAPCPEEWVKDTPLYKAISTEKDRRDEEVQEDAEAQALLERFAQALITVAELEKAVHDAGLDDKCNELAYDEFLIVYG